MGYLVSSIAGDVFFINYTPRLRAHPERYIASKFGAGMNQIASIFGPKDSQKPDKSTVFASIDDFKAALEKSGDIPFQQIAKGTYAKTFEGKQIEYIKIDEIPYIEYTYIVDGKPVVIRVPEGEIPPSQETVQGTTGQQP